MKSNEILWGNAYAPYSDIIVRFDNKKDLDEFGDLIGQKLSPKIRKPATPLKQDSEWVGMPAFQQDAQEPFSRIVVRVSKADIDAFTKVIGQKVTAKTKSIWHPKLVRGDNSSLRWVGHMTPRYPIYIVSKGRWKTRLTVKALERMRVPYSIVVEQSEYDEYAKVIDKDKILVLPQKYLDDYDTFDDLGNTKSKGPGAARNFCWQHSIDLGFNRHWVLDCNIDDFHRVGKNMKTPVRTGAIFAAAEDFVDRYENIYIAGFNYYSFCKTTSNAPPYKLNTRIYSCLLIQNDISFRWAGRYNEDTNLSLQVLKAGGCTVLFNFALCGKITTSRQNGGNTKDFYAIEGTKPKSDMLKKMHPDVTTIVDKFSRVHHEVDYKPFAKNKLILKKGITVPTGINEYGMTLVDGKMNRQEEEKALAKAF